MRARDAFSPVISVALAVGVVIAATMFTSMRDELDTAGSPATRGLAAIDATRQRILQLENARLQIKDESERRGAEDSSSDQASKRRALERTNAALLAERELLEEQLNEPRP